MSALDPEEDNVPTPDAQSSDMSKPGLQGAWNKWTSNPANNAALLQFGLAMLQPRSPGQSGVGQFANSIAAGGEAAGRVTANQKAEDAADLTEEATRAKMALEGKQGDASLINANAYKGQIDAINSNRGSGGTKDALQTQRQFNSWLMHPEDITGTTQDSIVSIIQKRHPEIKSKADLMTNDQARLEAYRLFQKFNTEPNMEGGDPGAPASTGASPAPAAPAFTGRRGTDSSGKAVFEVAPNDWRYPDGSRYRAQ
jgi:hypothetical protein